MEQIPIFQRIFNLIGWLTILTLACLIAILGYWYLVPINPIKFNNLPHKVESKEIKSGGYLVYDVDYCKYTKDIPMVSRTFVDGLSYPLYENRPATEKPMGCNVNRVQIYVPKGLPLGEYFLKTTFHYRLNPIRWLDVTTETERFLIVK